MTNNKVWNDYFKKKLATELAKIARLPVDTVIDHIEIPPDRELGDYSFPCFILAKQMKQSPKDIAESLKHEFNSSGNLTFTATNAGSYLNFKVDTAELFAHTIESVQKGRIGYAAVRQKRKKTVVIDFSSPNIAKPLSIAHLRSTVIGGALYKIMEALGYRVVGINHLGDWGTQFGKLLVAYQRWGSPEGVRKRGSKIRVKDLLDLYVRFHREEKENPELAEEARNWFTKLEKGDPEAVRLWKLFRKISVEEAKKLYRWLNIRFDYITGESFYNKMCEEVINRALELGVARQSKGAIIIPFEESTGMPPLLLRKKDCGTLYATRDIAAAIYRYRTYAPDLFLYVVGNDQKLYFRQLIKALELLGYAWSRRIKHVSFGLYCFSTGKLTTRGGRIVFMEDVLKKSVRLARKIIEEKNPGLKHKTDIARKVGISAIIFRDLVNDREKDVEFNWERIVNFDGETGPYIQYSYVRTLSVLKKYGGKFPRNLDLSSGIWEKNSQNILEREKILVRALYNFRTAVFKSQMFYKPSFIAQSLLDVARSFNQFYHNCPIIRSDPPLGDLRILLTDCTRKVLRFGMKILGMECPEKM